MKLSLTKSSLHFEKQKFQKKVNNKIGMEGIVKNIQTEESLGISKKRGLRKEIENYKISVKGIDLSLTENRAIHAIQTLMTQKEYYEKTANIHEIPEFKFNITEYLAAFGVIEFKRSNGKIQFSSSETNEALNALSSVSEKKFFIDYDRIYYVKKTKRSKLEKRIDRIRETANLLNIKQSWEGLTENEIRILDCNNYTDTMNRKRKSIIIIPHRILVDQIDSYFLIKKSDYLREIKKVAGKVSGYTIKIIDLLLIHVAYETRNIKNRELFNWIFKRNWKVIGINIFMTESSYWKHRKWNKIREIITRSYEIAKELGYIIDYKVDDDFDTLFLNKEKFYQPEITTK